VELASSNKNDVYEHDGFEMMEDAENKGSKEIDVEENSTDEESDVKGDNQVTPRQSQRLKDIRT